MHEHEWIEIWKLIRYNKPKKKKIVQKPLELYINSNTQFLSDNIKTIHR